MRQTLKNFLKEQKGIGLVEVIAALGISVVVITSLLSLTLFSLRTSLQSTLLMEGTKAANTQMELVRAYRDQTSIDWATFVSTTSGCTPALGGCYIDINANPLVVKTGSMTTTAGGTPGTPILTRFYAAPVSTAIQVTVQSAWSVGGQNKETFVYTDFTNWQQK